MAHVSVERHRDITLPGIVVLVTMTCAGCASSSPGYGSDNARRPDNSLAIALTDSARIPFDRKKPDRKSTSLIDRHRMLVEIMSLMGTPYSFDGTDSTGIDCSGLTSKIFSDVRGDVLPHSCKAQFATGRRVERRDLQFGDLVFFTAEDGSPSHVGIYVGDGLFAHASVSSGVTISLLNDTYYKKRYIGARRIVSP